jgi:hypothetical protein
MTAQHIAPAYQASRLEGACTLDIEQTPESLHAWAPLEGVEIHAGDTVLLHGAPAGIAFGERAFVEIRYTVLRANWFVRTWTQLTGLLELAELYEVGFLPKEAS